MVIIGEAPKWNGHGAGWIVPAVRAGLEEHLQQRADLITDGLLDLTIKQAVSNDIGHKLRVQVEGNLNGAPFRTEYQAYRKGSVFVTGGAVAGGVVGALVGTAITKALQLNKGADEAMRPCLEECVEAINEAIDRHIGVPLSMAGRRWQRLDFVGKSLAVASSVVCLILAIGVRLFAVGAGRGASGFELLQPLLVGVGGLCFIGVPLYGITLAYGCLTLPDDFFLSEAGGRRLLLKAGASTPGQLRILIWTVFIAIAIVATGIGIYMATKDRKVAEIDRSSAGARLQFV